MIPLHQLRAFFAKKHESPLLEFLHAYRERQAQEKPYKIHFNMNKHLPRLGSRSVIKFRQHNDSSLSKLRSGVHPHDRY